MKDQAVPPVYFDLKKAFVGCSMLVCLFSFQKTFAQCGGGLGPPLFNETFGAGLGYGKLVNGFDCTGAQIKGVDFWDQGETGYVFYMPPGPVIDPCNPKHKFTQVDDGAYTITTNPSIPKGDWVSISDHTGDPNGRMLIVNAAYTAGIFYKRRVRNLCPNTNFRFSAWFVEINGAQDYKVCSGNPQGKPIPANVRFEVQDTLGNIIDSTRTGDIYGQNSNNPPWINYFFNFNTGTYSTVDVVLRNIGIGGCGNDLAIDDITFRACGPNITAQLPNGNICLNNSITLTANLSAGYSHPYYQWQKSIDSGKTWVFISGANSASYTISQVMASDNRTEYRVSAAGDATTIKSASCSVTSNADTIKILLDKIVFKPPSSACSNSGKIDLSGYVSPKGGMFAMHGGGPGITGTVFDPTKVVAGAVYLVDYTYINPLTNCQTVVSANISVGPAPQPKIVRSGPKAICAGSTTTLSVAPGDMYQWYLNGVVKTGANSNTINADSTGLYKVVVTNGSGCNGSDTATVTVYAPIGVTVTGNGPATLCSGDTRILSTTAIGVSYKWTRNNNILLKSKGKSDTASVTGLYTVTVTDIHGCVDSGQFKIIVNPLPTPTITTNDPVIFCPGDSANLSTQSWSSYQWNKNGVAIAGANAMSFYAKDSAAYTVTVTNNFGCKATSPIFKIAWYPTPPIPTLVSLGATNFCSGDSDLLKITNYNPLFSYQWRKNGSALPGYNGPILSVFNSGAYTAAVTNASGCFSISAPVNVTVNPRPVAIINYPYTSTCAGMPVPLSASPTGPAGKYTYQWLANNLPIPGAQSATYSATKTNVYRVLVKNAASGCADTSFPVSIAVNPLPTPTIFPDNPTTFCAPGQATLEVSTTYNSYQWYRNGSPVAGPGTSSRIYVASVTGNYQVKVVDVNGCTNLSNTILVTVNPAPVLTLSPKNPEFCEGGNVTLSGSLAGPPGAYSWRLENIIIPGANSQTYVASKAGHYTATFKDVSGCIGNSDTSLVIVDTLPHPYVTITGAPKLCLTGGSDLTVNVPSIPGGSYQWHRLDTATLLDITIPGATSYNYLVPKAKASIGYYYVVVKTAKGCTNNSDTLKVNPFKPPISTLGHNNIICQGDTIVLYSPPGAKFQWYESKYDTTTHTYGPWQKADTVLPAGPAIPHSSQDSSYAAFEPGKYIVLVTDGSGCSGYSDTATIKTLVKLPVNIAGGGIICKDSVYNLVANVAAPYADPGGTKYNYQWYYNNAVVKGGVFNQLQPMGTGTYKVVVKKDGSFCAGSAMVTITVNTPVKPKLVPVKDTLCLGDSVVLTTTTPGSFTAFAWYRNGVFSAKTATFKVGSDGAYYVRTTDLNGCKANSDTAHVVTIPKPNTVISTNGPTEFCAGDSVKLAIVASPIYIYQWAKSVLKVGPYVAIVPKGNGPSLIVRDSGYYRIKITNQAGCFSSDSVHIVVDTIPTPKITGNATFCQGSFANLHSNDKKTKEISWAFGSQANIISHIPDIAVQNAGTYYLIAMNAKNGLCYKVDSFKVTQYVKPKASFSQPDTCQRTDSIQFVNNSTIAVGTIASYLWNFGDPASGIKNTDARAMPYHKFSGVGMYKVVLKAYSVNGCVDSTYQLINYRGTKPVALFNIKSINGIFCSNVADSLKDSSSVKVGSLVHYKWDFYDAMGNPALVVADTTKKTAVIFPPLTTDAKYRIFHTVVASSGCVDTISQYVTVHGVPVVSFKTLLPDVCLISGPYPLTSGAPPTGALGTGTYSGKGVDKGVFYPDSAGVGNHLITYTFLTKAGCTKSVVDSIHVHAAPDTVKINLPAVINPCDSTITLTAAVKGGAARYQWYRNDTLQQGQTANTYVATIPATYRVRAFSAYGCAHDTSIVIKALNHKPVADFTIGSICNNLQVNFYNKSYISDKTPLSYLWNFGDGATSTSMNPSHSYLTQGTFTVTLKTTSAAGCTVTAIKPEQITSVDSSVRFNIVTAKPYCTLEPMVFVDSTVLPGRNILKYKWVFYAADGVTLLPNQPSDSSGLITYTFPKVNVPTAFYVQEQVYTSDGCPILSAKKGLVIDPKDSVIYNREAPLKMCRDAQPFALTGGATVPNDPNGTGKYVGSGVDTVAKQFDPQKAQSGDNTVSYIFTNQYGCKSAASINYQVNDTIPLTGATYKVKEHTVITLNGIGSLPFTFGPDGITAITPDSIRWNWSPGTGLSNTTSPTPYFEATDNIAYTLTITPPSGCKSRAVFNVQVLKDLVIPNAFSPNHDGHNDTWIIHGIEAYHNVEVFIFNRWGQQLWYSKGYGNPWDGTLNGSELPTGTYYYLIKLNQNILTNQNIPLAGPLTIIY